MIINGRFIRMALILKLLDEAQLQVKKIMAGPDGSPQEEAFGDAI